MASPPLQFVTHKFSLDFIQLCLSLNSIFLAFLAIRLIFSVDLPLQLGFKHLSLLAKLFLTGTLLLLIAIEVTLNNFIPFFLTHA